MTDLTHPLLTQSHVLLTAHPERLRIWEERVDHDLHSMGRWREDGIPMDGLAPWSAFDARKAMMLRSTDVLEVLMDYSEVDASVPLRKVSLRETCYVSFGLIEQRHELLADMPLEGAYLTPLPAQLPRHRMLITLVGATPAEQRLADAPTETFLLDAPDHDAPINESLRHVMPMQGNRAALTEQHLAGSLIHICKLLLYLRLDPVISRRPATRLNQTGLLCRAYNLLQIGPAEVEEQVHRSHLFRRRNAKHTLEPGLFFAEGPGGKNLVWREPALRASPMGLPTSI